jgi:hypothetical protein
MGFLSRGRFAKSVNLALPTIHENTQGMSDLHAGMHVHILCQAARNLHTHACLVQVGFTPDWFGQTATKTDPRLGVQNLLEQPPLTGTTCYH